jgi:hypothetical protein
MTITINAEAKLDCDGGYDVATKGLNVLVNTH